MGETTMNHCLSEEELEEYHFNRLMGEALDAAEEHLLICESCQRRSEEELRIAGDIRSALRDFEPAKMPVVMQPRQSPPRVRWQAWALTSAAAVLICVIAIAWNAARPREFEVALRTERGIAQTSAPQGRNLILTAQLQELPPLERFHVVLVDATGPMLESADVVPNGETLVWRVGRSLPAGTYWVRLYDARKPQSALREFGLKVR